MSLSQFSSKICKKKSIKPKKQSLDSQALFDEKTDEGGRFFISFCISSKTNEGGRLFFFISSKTDEACIFSDNKSSNFLEKRPFTRYYKVRKMQHLYTWTKPHKKSILSAYMIFRRSGKCMRDKYWTNFLGH